jgi:chromosome segregation ATPase
VLAYLIRRQRLNHQRNLFSLRGKIRSQIEDKQKLSADSKHTTIVEYIEQLISSTSPRRRLLASGSTEKDASNPIDLSTAATQMHLLLLEMLHASVLKNDPTDFDWEALESKLKEIIPAPAPLNNENDIQLQAEIKQLKSQLAFETDRVSNLEEFKEMFASMQKKWQEAREQNLEYYKQLCELPNTSDNESEKVALLNQYNSSYEDVDELIENLIPIKLEKIEISTHEMEELNRNIEDSRAKIEAQQATIENLNKLIRESENYVAITRHELEKTEAQIKELEEALEKSDEMTKEMEAMQKIINRFAIESRDMLVSLQILEQENSDIRSKLNQAQADSRAGTSQDTSGPAPTDSNQDFEELQKDYMNLEKSYTSITKQIFTLTDQCDQLEQSLRGKHPDIADRLTSIIRDASNSLSYNDDLD